jgi:hypothetical protein
MVFVRQERRYEKLDPTPFSEKIGSDPFFRFDPGFSVTPADAWRGHSS